MSQVNGKKDLENPISQPNVTVPNATDNSDVVLEPDAESDLSTALEADNSSLQDNKKSKYADSKWKQQSTISWRPSIELEKLWPGFLIVGIIILAIGGLIMWANSHYVSFEHDYTNCKPNKGSNESCSDIINNDSTAKCICTEETIDIPVDISGRVTISYELTNFYQNQRPYIMSKDDEQLLGHVYENYETKTIREPDDDCKPLQKSKDGKVIYPCGALANSFFTDEILLENDNGEEIKLEKVPAWISHKKKFANPQIQGFKDCNDESITKNFAKPPAWSEQVWETFCKNGGVTGGDFSYWMRTAAFSEFRNPYRTFEKTGVSTCAKDFKGLCKGKYKLIITYRFDTTSFEGTKKIRVSNNAILNDQNNFFVIGFLAVGCVLIFLAFLSCLCNLVSRNSKVQPEYVYDYDPELSNVPEKEPEPLIVDHNQPAGHQNNPTKVIVDVNQPAEYLNNSPEVNPLPQLAQKVAEPSLLPSKQSLSSNSESQQPHLKFKNKSRQKKTLPDAT